MKFVSLMALALFAAVSIAHASTAEPGHGAPTVAPATADAWLHEIYDRYIGPPDQTRWIDYSDPKVLRYYFEPGLVAMIEKDFAAAAKVDEVPTLDGDPFIDAQEWDIKSFDIRVTAGADADHATAVVKFVNYEPKEMHVTLIRVGGQWKIYDVVSNRPDGSLRGLFAKPRE